MNTNFKNLTDFHKYFKDEETCRNYLAKQRWDGVVTCPFCKSERIYFYKDGKRFRCAEKTLTWFIIGFHPKGEINHDLLP